MSRHLDWKGSHRGKVHVEAHRVCGGRVQRGHTSCPELLGHPRLELAPDSVPLHKRQVPRLADDDDWGGGRILGSQPTREAYGDASHGDTTSSLVEVNQAIKA